MDPEISWAPTKTARLQGELHGFPEGVLEVHIGGLALGVWDATLWQTYKKLLKMAHL